MGKNDALVEDARWYAEDQGVSDEEAIRRMRLGDCFTEDLSDLERALKRNEGDSFAGLWVEHDPEYRFVVLFTESGRKRIQPYIDGEPYAPLMDVRSGAEIPFAELRTVRRKADRLVEKLELEAGSSLNIQKNRAELYVTSRERFEAKLRKNGVRLPERVVLVEQAPLRPS